MSSDAGDLSELQELTGEDFATFTRCARALIARSFLIRGLEDELYDFAVRNFTLLESYFACMGTRLTRDEGLGVVAWRGSADTRINLAGDETCGLLTLRLLYEEKRNAVSLTDFPTITVFDFTERYKATTERELRKTRLIIMLRRFNSARLIKAPREEGDPDGQILLYPSIALVLDQEGIEETLAWIRSSKDAKDGGEAAGTTEPVTAGSTEDES